MLLSKKLNDIQGCRIFLEDAERAADGELLDKIDKLSERMKRAFLERHFVSFLYDSKRVAFWGGTNPQKMRENQAPFFVFKELMNSIAII